MVGEHPGDFPVENLTLSRDKHLLASCSHDQKIKFWNLDSVKSEKVNSREKAGKGNKKKFLKSSDKGDFYADLADDEKSATTSTANDDDNSDKDDDDDCDSDSD